MRTARWRQPWGHSALHTGFYNIISRKVLFPATPVRHRNGEGRPHGLLIPLIYSKNLPAHISRISLKISDFVSNALIRHTIHYNSEIICYLLFLPELDDVSEVSLLVFLPTGLEIFTGSCYSVNAFHHFHTI